MKQWNQVGRKQRENLCKIKTKGSYTKMLTESK